MSLCLHAGVDVLTTSASSEPKMDIKNVPEALVNASKLVCVNVDACMCDVCMCDVSAWPMYVSGGCVVCV